MSVVIETTIGDITVDLYLKERPNACLNFLKLCRIKYYNLCVFYKVERNFIAQTGDPTATGRGGESVFCRLYGEQAKYFDSELKPRLKHEKFGTLSMVNNGNNMLGSQFFLTLGENLTYLDEVHTVFGEVVEGFDILRKLNEAICDPSNRPYQDIRITHTVVLHDPYDDPSGLEIPDASPVPTKEMLESGYIGADEEIDDTKGKDAEEIEEKIKESEAKARATILEMVGDLPDADVKPPENVLFVCKLNPVTTSEDLEIIFSRFGKIVSCEVIKDRKSGDSLQYAFIEFDKEEDCENAYFKMDNVLIDDRRIHVDFSQSVSKLNWENEAKSKLKGLSKRQNFVLKDSQKKSDSKYDMVFDINEDRAPRNSKAKHHRQSPNRRNDKRTNIPYDSNKSSQHFRERHSKDRHGDNYRRDYDHNSSSLKHKNGTSTSRESRNRHRDSRSPYKKTSPNKRGRGNGSTDRYSHPEHSSKTSYDKPQKYRMRHDSSESGRSISPGPMKSSHMKKSYSANVSSSSKPSHKKTTKKNSSGKRKQVSSSSSSSSTSSSSSSSSSDSSPSPVRKSLKNDKSSNRQSSPEVKNYKQINIKQGSYSRSISHSPKRNKKPKHAKMTFLLESPNQNYSKPDSRSGSPHTSHKKDKHSISRQKSSHKRYSRSPELSKRDRQPESSDAKSFYSKDEYDKEKRRSKFNKAFSKDSSEEYRTHSKSKSSFTEQHESSSKKDKHFHKEHKRRRRSSS